MALSIQTKATTLFQSIISPQPAANIIQAKPVFKGLKEDTFMREAIALSNESVGEHKGGPIGAIVVKDGKIIGRGISKRNHNPVSHAEINAIKEAANYLKSSNLKGATLYTSTEPCPLCLAASYWANIGKIYYANTTEDSSQFFKDGMIYQEFAKKKEDRSIPTLSMPHLRNEAQEAFKKWGENHKKRT